MSPHRPRSAQELPPPRVDPIGTAKLQDLLELPIDLAVFVEEMPLTAGERAELAAEYRLPDEPVGSISRPVAVE